MKNRNTTPILHLLSSIIGTFKAHPALILPAKELIFHASSIPVLVDGAHSLGQIPVSMQDLDADFFVASGHKWLYAPPSGILYVKKKYHDDVHPAVISYHCPERSFSERFGWIGTTDWSGMLSLGFALDFVDWTGFEESREYKNSLCKKVGEYFSERWGSKADLGLDEESTMIASMFDVEIPFISILYGEKEEGLQ